MLVGTIYLMLLPHDLGFFMPRPRQIDGKSEKSFLRKLPHPDSARATASSWHGSPTLNLADKSGNDSCQGREFKWQESTVRHLDSTLDPGERSGYRDQVPRTLEPATRKVIWGEHWSRGAMLPSLGKGYSQGLKRDETWWPTTMKTIVTYCINVCQASCYFMNISPYHAYNGWRRQGG